MAKKSTENTRKLRDLPPETRLEVERSRAKIAAEKVKIGDSKAEIREHQANIEKLKGT